MNLAAASADRRRLTLIVASAALLTMSIASFLTSSSDAGTRITLLLAYAGGMAMLLTP
jgi:hypothetical protein